MNNSTTPSPSTIDIGLTDAELWIQLTCFYILLCGVYCTVANCIIALTIYKTKSLRTRFFVIIGFLSAGRCLESAQMLVVGVQRALRTVGVVSFSQKRYVCNLIHFWLLHGMTFESLLFLTLVVDRVAAVAYVAKYRTFKLGSVCRMAVAACISSILAMNAPAFVGIDLNETVLCVNTYSAISDISNRLFRVIDFVLIFSVVAAYAALALYIRFRYAKIDQTSSTEAELVTVKRQLALIPYLRNQVIMHVSLSLTTKLMYFLAAVYVQEGKRIAAYGGILMTIDLFLNTSLLLFRNKEICVASSNLLRNFWNKKSNHVSPVSIIGPKTNNTAV